MVTTSACHTVVRVSIIGPGMIITCKNLDLNIVDCVYLVGRGSSMVGSKLRNLGKFDYPALPVCPSDETLQFVGEKQISPTSRWVGCGGY